jgi:short chain dehydrogenase
MIKWRCLPLTRTPWQPVDLHAHESTGRWRRQNARSAPEPAVSVSVVAGRPLVQIPDRVAVVTGGASGIGRAIAVAMAEAGARVVVAGIDDAGGATTTTGHTGLPARPGARQAGHGRTHQQKRRDPTGLLERHARTHRRNEVDEATSWARQHYRNLIDRLAQ